MLLLAAAIFGLILGVATFVVLLELRYRGPLRHVIEGTTVFVLTASMLWVATILLPPFLLLIVVGAGVFLVVLTRLRYLGRSRPGFFFAGLGAAIVGYPFLLAILDLALSTRDFGSDRQLVAEAVQRALSSEDSVGAAALLGTTALGAALGYLAGRVNLRPVGPPE
jgi:hypothetical protein